MSCITLRFLAEPNSANFSGKVPGGTVMKWIDEAGYACATRWAKGNCSTVSVAGLRFKRPILIGELVEVDARLAYTGKTSMNIAVEVRSGNMKSDQMEYVTECLVVFVAVDPDGKPMPVKTFYPETPGDIALAQRVKAHLDAVRRAQPASGRPAAAR